MSKYKIGDVVRTIVPNESLCILSRQSKIFTIKMIIGSENYITEDGWRLDDCEIELVSESSRAMDLTKLSWLSFESWQDRYENITNDCTADMLRMGLGNEALFGIIYKEQTVSYVGLNGEERPEFTAGKGFLVIPSEKTDYGTEWFQVWKLKKGEC